MRTVLIFLTIILWKFQVEAQIVSPSRPEDIGYEAAELKHHITNGAGKLVSEKDIAGSPFLDKQFQKSYILKVNGAEIKNLPLRYNLYNNSMEMIQDGQVLTISFPSEIQRINMGGNVFIYAKYTTPQKIGFGFFQVLYEGDYQLLKKDQVILKTPDNTGDSLRFVRSFPQFYLRYGEGMAYWINSQKSLIKRLQPLSQSTIDYIKSNKINAKDEKKLMELMEYIADSPK